MLHLYIIDTNGPPIVTVMHAHCRVGISRMSLLSDCGKCFLPHLPYMHEYRYIDDIEDKMLMYA